MNHRKQTSVICALVFFTVALLSYGPLWAQSATPNFTETIIDGNTKVVFAGDGSITVYFLDENCTPTATDDCWGDPVTPQQAYIFICKEDPANEGEILPCNVMDDPTLNVEYYPIKQAGAGTTGCLVKENPRTYLYGGDGYTR
jgi:hypothetical protein